MGSMEIMSCFLSVRSRFVWVWALVGVLVLADRDAFAQAPNPANPPASRAPAATTPANSTQATATQPATNPPPPAAEVTESATEQLRKESIQQRITAVNTMTDMPEATKAEILKNYQNSVAEIDRILAARKSIETFKKIIADAPTEIEAAKKARQDGSKDSTKTSTAMHEQIEGIQSAAELEKLLQESEAQLKEVTSAFSKIDGEPKVRADRVAAIQAIMQSNKAELDQYAASNTPAPAAATPDAPPTEESLSKMTFQQIHREALLAVQERLQLELDSFKATADLLPLKLDTLAVEKVRLEKLVAALSARVNEMRKNEAKKEVEEKKEQAKTVAPELAPLADELTALAEVRNDIANKLSALNEEKERMSNMLTTQRKQFEETQKQTDSSGMSAQAGQLLRREREALPDTTALEREIADRDELLGNARFTSNEYKSKRLEFADLEAKKTQWLNKLRAENSAFELTKELESQLDDLLAQQREQTSDITGDYDKYITRLTEYSEIERSLISDTKAYSDYIREHVLWIRSTYPLTTAREFRPTPAAVAWVISPENWMAVGSELKSDISRRPELWFVFSLSVLVLFAFQRPVRRWLIKESDVASRRSAMEFLPTLKVIGYTLFLTALVPMTLAFVGWRLSSSLSEFAFVRALSDALLSTSGVCLCYELLRHICRRKGLVQSHLDWEFDRLPAIRRSLLLSVWINLPLWFVVMLLESQTEDALRSSSLGRLCFLGLMVINIGFAMSLFNLGKKPVPEVFETWDAPLKWIVVVFLCAMALLAIVGYYETALVLTERLFLTVMSIFLIAVTNGVFARMVLVNRRRIAVEQAKIRREAQAQAQTSESPVSPVNIAARNATEDLIDLTSATAQTRKFIRAAALLLGMFVVWQIWETVLPALNQIEAFHVSGEPEGVLHLGDIIFLGFSLVITYLVATTLPGFIELTILARLPLDKGARYAISTLSSYVVTLIGIVIAGATLRLKWDDIQWLVAALSVGLGFGLQEIFANFVSGLILLFERPIRVGDVVTLGSTTGLVSRIRIRSTTITDWDEKEYIVPNKDLITGSILNWTLSSTRNRVVLSVSVSYDSDTRKVRRLLEEICRDHESIMKEPAPLVNFDKFGDSALLFAIRFYLPTLDNRVNIIDEIHNRIIEKFRQEGIEMAFPHQDLRILSWPEMMPRRSGMSTPSSTVPGESNGSSILQH
jgi:potassium efflux system protein